MKMIGLLLALAATTAQAQQGFWYHPEASEIVAADPTDITVCQWWPNAQDETSFGPGYATWECETFWAYNARAPLTLKLNQLGPVRVWSRWAYAKDAYGHLAPMQDAAY